MKSKSFMLMILSMGFGLIAAIGISQVMGRSNSTAQPVTQMAPVLVAADVLDMNALLTEENVKIENWPANIIPEDAATTIEDIKDMIIRTRLSKGMPIQKSTIINKNKRNDLTIPEGFKVVAIKVTGEELIGGLLNPGDKVDVIGLFKRRSSTGQQQNTTRTFLKALRVFSVNNRMTAVEDRSEGGNSSGAIVSLLVTEKQSEQIYFVQKTGELKLVLRGDSMASDDETEDLEDIMDWGDELPEVAETEAEAPKSSLFSKFASGFGSEPKKTSMIIWSNGSAEQVFFQPGAIPQRSVGSVPAFDVPARNNVEEESGNDDDDSNVSEEIDRGLGQDQYRGQ